MAKPNIVYILADDMGYGDVSCLNENAAWKTRHIDRLAAEGMVFTDAHSGSAVCTPTRYGVLTGRYAWRTRLKRGVLNGYNLDQAPNIAADPQAQADGVPCHELGRDCEVCERATSEEKNEGED